MRWTYSLSSLLGVVTKVACGLGLTVALIRLGAEAPNYPFVAASVLLLAGALGAAVGYVIGGHTTAATSLQIASLAGYVASFFLPVFVLFDDVELGISVFDAFFQGVLYGDAESAFLWAPNPFYWVASVLLICGRYLPAFIFSYLATLFASPFLTDQAWLGGYYVWLTAMGLLILATVVRLLGRSNRICASRPNSTVPPSN